jgi:ATP-binding cassette subfamily F protein uup
VKARYAESLVALLSLDRVSLAFGHLPLFEEASLRIDPGERICLIGRNGAGKSSLLKVVSGEQAADGGTIWRAPGLRVSRLDQEVPLAADRTVFDEVAAGLGELGALVAQYHHAAVHLADTPGGLDRLGALQHQLEERDGWRLEQKVETVVSRLSLPADRPLRELSGGWRRRTLLGKALVSEPDLLLLDEPTNHLDIDAIRWLEESLRTFSGALLFVTHDRAFLSALATRIVDLDRGVVTSWPGNYASYLEKKAAAEEADARARERLDKKLAEEEAWLRRGVKARHTQRIMRGDRIGLIGANGSGKTTLLKLLVGELTPDRGTVTRGARVEIAYFDQQREQLDPDRSVVDSVNDGSDTVIVNGQPRHVVGYLADFLFPRERAISPVRSLSGGERNRLMLARLFARPANVLVMDEPTNDLDIETLELLEELVADFPGTVLLVSHDRTFLDNVVTSTLAFESGGSVVEYVGGWQDYLRQAAAGEAPGKAAGTPAGKGSGTDVGGQRAKAPGTGKLSFKEQREFDDLPGRIDALETEQAQLRQESESAAFYKEPAEHIRRVLARIDDVGRELDAALTRWVELEARVPTRR